MLRKKFMAVCMFISMAAINAYCENVVERLYGTVIYSDNDVIEKGVYSFNLTGEPQQEAIPEGKELEANGGGFFANGCYYFNQEMELYGSEYRYHYIYEFPSWKKVSRTSFYNKYDMANDMAYDPMLGCAFGCFPDGTACYFGSVSIPDFNVIHIGDALPNQYSGIAIDNQGKVYAIDDKGELFSVDKFTGKATSIGNTGLVAEYQSSAVFDDKTALIYYSINTESESKLYTIDPITAKASFVYDFPNSEQVVGLFIPNEQSPEAPASVIGLAVEPGQGNLKAKVSFTMPSSTYAGTEMSGNIDYEIRINDVVATFGSAAAGTEVTKDVDFSAKGEYTITVFAIKNNMRSIVSVTKKYIGNDTPKAVQNAKINYSNEIGGFTISWDMVSQEGVNGGYVDPAKTSYTVVRYPDEITIAESIHETTLFDEVTEPAEGLVQYYYTIAPTYEGASGESTKTNAISLGTIVPPYDQPFNSADALSGYTIIPNSSFNNNQWVYRSGAVKGPKDSWLITPAMKLNGGYTYNIAFEMKSEYGYVEESMSIYMGSEPTKESMTTQVLSSTNIKSTSFRSFSANMTPETSGIYYLGFVCDSQAWNSYGIYVKNLTISAGEMSGIESVAEACKSTVYSIPGAICIATEDTTTTIIFDISGKQIDCLEVAGYAEIGVSPGVYIVRSGQKISKIIVR